MTVPSATRAETLRGSLFLLGASLIWGGAFVPQSFTVVEMGPLFATAIRFSLAVPFSAGLAFAFRRHRGPRPRVRDVVLLGALLYVAFYLQTYAVKVAPITRVSFITGTYAVFVPLLAPLFGLPRPRALHFLGAGVAVFGLSLLVELFTATDTPVGLGDGLTLGHAVLSAVHLLLIARLASRTDPVWLNGGQIVVMALCAIPIAFVFETPPPLALFDARLIGSFLYLAALSSSVAFLLQIAGQRTASAPAASVIMILESPVGAALAVLLIDEHMDPIAVLGAAIMMMGVGLSVTGDLRAARARGLT